MLYNTRRCIIKRKGKYLAAKEYYFLSVKIYIKECKLRDSSMQAYDDLITKL